MTKEAFEYAEEASRIGHEEYLESGGIINKDDVRSAWDKSQDSATWDKNDPSLKSTILQARSMAERAGLELESSSSGLDPRVALYVTLRTDEKPENVEYHHSSMSDQRLFGEVLRLSGDMDAFRRFDEAHPNISFEYEKDDEE